MPQDTQAEAYDYPTAFFEKRVWQIPRNRPDSEALRQAAAWIRESQQPLIIAGGGVHYSDACDALERLVERCGIPVGETHAGKGALAYDNPLNLGAIGVTGTEGANILARETDLVIGIGTRYSDFTSASKTAFGRDGVRFININVAEFDAYKHNALPLVGDARVTLDELLDLLPGYATDAAYQQRARAYNAAWDAEVHRIYNLEHEPLAEPGRGHRHGQLAVGGGRHGALRRGQHAGRPAQTLADAQPPRLQPGIRLFDHGLRDRWRHGRGSWLTPIAKSGCWSAMAPS